MATGEHREMRYSRGIVLWCYLFVVGVFGTSWYIGENGSDSNSGKNVTAPLRTLGFLSTVIMPADVVYFLPGQLTMLSNAVMFEFNITFSALEPNISTFIVGNVANTIVFASGGRVQDMGFSGIEFQFSSAISFDNATFMNCQGNNCISSKQFTATSISLTGSKIMCGVESQAIVISGAENCDVHFRNNTISDCSGGGVVLTFPSADNSVIVEIDTTSFTRLNFALSVINANHTKLTCCNFTSCTGSGALGGGALTLGNVATGMISNVSIWENSGAVGGMMISESDITLQYVIFYSNTATIFGGGIGCEFSNLTLGQSVAFVENTNEVEGAPQYSGAASCQECTFRVVDYEALESLEVRGNHPLNGERVNAGVCWVELANRNMLGPNLEGSVNAGIQDLSSCESLCMVANRLCNGFVYGAEDSPYKGGCWLKNQIFPQFDTESYVTSYHALANQPLPELAA
eukprot:TRINITY_DN18883_c0_g1_i1.p1 TRINITY_DN18883_c0_g1~~TRINITY_DN18883_c0_g1_i1.p1  ORF type:complete len:461 (-),score=37.73 TRINITY_DN18883_c0_g1_i1:62-1444(-)